MSSNYKFEIALSFADENRPYVEKIAACLKSNGVEYFYDDDKKSEMWGKDLVEFFEDIYKNKAKFCVIFISKDCEWNLVNSNTCK